MFQNRLNPESGWHARLALGSKGSRASGRKISNGKVGPGLLPPAAKRHNDHRHSEPETEGLETIRAFRRYDAEVKIIATSGAGQGRAGGYLELTLKFGARRIIPKPFTQDELLTAVAEVLGTVT